MIFEELFARIPDLELAGEPERLRSNFLAGVKHLPVRFTPGDAGALRLTGVTSAGRPRRSGGR